MILNPFETNDAFSLVSLTKAINIMPNNYGRIRELNLMPGKGVRTRNVLVEEQNGVLNLLPTEPVGAPGTKNKMGKRSVRSFAIPHIPLEDTILPDEYDGIRAFGQESAVDTLAAVMNNHLQTARNKFAITLEHLRIGALKGIILDADGTTLYNLYTEFGIAQETVDFLLGTGGTNVPEKCREVVRHIEDNLKGEVMSDVHCLVDESFYDKLVKHASVTEIYKNWAGAQERLGGDLRKGFRLGGITFEEYRGTATDGAGNARKFIASDYGIAFPLGTMNSFETLFAPGNFLETVNTLGLEIYAKQEARKFNAGVDIWMEMNALPICYRPAILVTVRTSN
jgi:hypothetical protein